MTSATLIALIAAAPGKMGGKPVISGRRMTPPMVLNMPANGVIPPRFNSDRRPPTLALPPRGWGGSEGMVF